MMKLIACHNSFITFELSQCNGWHIKLTKFRDENHISVGFNECLKLHNCTHFIWKVSIFCLVMDTVSFQKQKRLSIYYEIFQEELFSYKMFQTNNVFFRLLFKSAIYFMIFSIVLPMFCIFSIAKSWCLMTSSSGVSVGKHDKHW